MSKKLLKFYEDILSVGSMKADKEGFVTGHIGKMSAPVTIGGKRLVIPTKNQLTNPNWDDRIVFHPFYENIVRGESQVIEKLRNLILSRINYTVGVIGQMLLDLAASNARHSSLKPDQSEFLAKVGNADEKSLTNFQSILKAISPADSKKNFVHMYLKRNGTIGEKKFFRIGVVSFPILAELNNDTIYGVKVRVKDKDIYKNLIEYIFPNAYNESLYSAGSSSQIAPYSESLLRTTVNVIAQLNDVITLFKNVIPEFEELEFSSDWISTLDSIDALVPDIKSIPLQAGNEGSAVLKTDTPEPTAPVGNPAVVAPVAAPVQNTAYPFAPVQNVPVQQPSIVKSSAGTDFASVLASNPAIAGNMMYMQNQFNPMMQQRSSVPRFAQPDQMPFQNQFGQQQFGQQFGQQQFGGQMQPFQNGMSPYGLPPI